jgi:4-alpha-glucanotransferase
LHLRSLHDDKTSLFLFASLHSHYVSANEEEMVMTSLESLAELSGIELQFVDAHGRTQEASQETQRTLLTAMGVEAETDANASASLDAMRRLEWERPLPPVLVVCGDADALTIDLTLPTTTVTVRWFLRLEDGGERRGEADFASLALVDRQTFDSRVLERRRLEVGSVPFGYHRLTVDPRCSEATVIVTPGRCWLPPTVTLGRRIWGVAAQLYLLRSASNWGIGDYGDLRQLVQIVGEKGADIVGLNPLHAMFLDDPEHASPYSPASRLLLNELNIDVPNVPELSQSKEAHRLIGSSEFQKQLEACRSSLVVDYGSVANLKLQVLRLLYAACRAKQPSDRWSAFEAFRRDRGDVLERSCLFLALREHFSTLGHADWLSWPAAYQDPGAPEVAQFARDHEALVTFHAWLQWVADSQLAAAAEGAGTMGVGLYRDLAVGAHPAGAETWANQRAVVAGVQVGCPPDIYNPAGQDWGLPPFNPLQLQEEAYQSFIDLVRANMRHAGALRIDHVMALRHVYWIPKGQAPAQGAYVRYPLEDLVGILALESQRNSCLVVGEDLGTVPEGFRERMAMANIMSYRVLSFEKDAKGFLPPDSYPRLSLAVAGNHDLPTLQGWWEARDVALKERLNLFPSVEAAASARAEREAERAQLAVAMRAEGLLPDDAEMDVETLIRIAHTFLGRSTAMIAMAQIDDLAAEVDPVNVPTTSDQHPNWRRRVSLTLDELASHPRFSAIATSFAAERGSNASDVEGWREAVALAEAELPAYLLKQLWYPAKDAGAPIVALEQLVLLPVPRFCACIAVWSASSQGGKACLLFLPLAIAATGTFGTEDPAIIGHLQSGELLVDALCMDGFVQYFIRVMLGYDIAPVGVEAGHTLPARQIGLDAQAAWSIHRGQAEQSNTSIRINGSAILKALRTINRGQHPELEMGRFLTEEARFKSTPALLGWITLRGMTLAILQAFVDNEGDGWTWLLERLRGSDGERSAALAWVRRLGERTAEMHQALASPTADAAFRAEPITAEDLASWKAEINSMLERVLEGLKALRPRLDAATTSLAITFEERQGILTQRIDHLLAVAISGHKTRHHGDFHLGQVLVQGDDAVIVDFEGEPLRSLAERRKKHSPLRDVAGMLRSIDYVAALVAREQIRADTLREWTTQASVAFRDSYFRVAGNDAPDETRVLIEFFTLEKALYEVTYELANRPDWVSIPLSAINLAVAA